MDQRCGIINQCLWLLEQSDVPTIKRLRIKIQLYQMQRLLLHDAARSAVDCGSCGVQVFEGLLSRMRGVFEEKWQGQWVAVLSGIVCR